MALQLTHAQNLDLHLLSEGIHSGVVVLPDFQRDFDWSSSDVCALLATVLSGWPIGSLLLIDGSPGFIKTRPFDGAPSASSRIEYVVLDGQQRLTALYHALYGVGDDMFALRVDLVAPGDVDSIEQALVYIRRDDWDRNYAHPAQQLDRQVLPVAALKTAADFFAWRDEICSYAADPEQMSASLTALYRTLLSGIHRYEVPAIVLSQSIEPGAIARIFERVNRTGLRLGTFDLMVARSFTADFNLRSQWEAARDERPRLEAFFGDDGLPVLQVLALRNRLDLRQSAVLDLSGQSVRDGWKDAIRHLDNALEFAVRHLGVWTRDWLPYSNIMTILAGISYEFELESNRPMLTNWYWATVLGGRYDVASNTRAVADFKFLSDRVLPPEAIRLTLGFEESLSATKKLRGAFHRGFLNVLASRMPMDLANGNRLTPDTVLLGDPSSAEEISLFRKEYTDVADAHLRTLTFIIGDRRTARTTTRDVLATATSARLEGQLLVDSAVNLDVIALLEARLERLVSHLSATGLETRIAIDEPQTPNEPRHR